MRGEEEKKISRLPPSSMSHFHVPFFSDCDNEFSLSAATFAPASCQITKFILMPDYGVMSGAHMRVAYVAVL